MPEHGSPEDLARSAMLLRPCTVTLPNAAWSAAEADGWDMSLVICELEKPAEQRIREHDYALRQATEMREAFQKAYGRPDAAH
jgi:hypothetical protein